MSLSIERFTILGQFKYEQYCQPKVVLPQYCQRVAVSHFLLAQSPSLFPKAGVIYIKRVQGETYVNPSN